MTKTVDNKAFRESYLDGLPPTQWLAYAQALNNALSRGELEKNAYELRKTFLQGVHVNNDETLTSTAK